MLNYIYTGCIYSYMVKLNDRNIIFMHCIYFLKDFNIVTGWREERRFLLPLA